MAAAIALREDHSVEDLGALARQSGTSDSASGSWPLRRWPRGATGVTRRKLATWSGKLCAWAHRFNDEGSEGLLDRKTAGPAPKMTAAQKAELDSLVEGDPDRKKDGVVRWGRFDLIAVIENRFGVVYR